MRAVVHHRFGEPSEVLGVEDVPTPEPGAGQVRVRLLASPIHNHDLWTVRGDYGYKPELPARAGTEAAGVVDALGEGVENVRVGQRVATGGTFGAWAEYFVAGAAGLVPVPEDLPDEVAAQVVAMPFSAISLVDFLDLHEGDWLVQNAANGAVGRLVAQLATGRGLHVLGRHHRAQTQAHVQGAQHLVARDSPELGDEAEDGRLGPAPGAEHGLEAVGDAAGQVAGEPAAGDVREALHRHRLGQREHLLGVDEGRGEQRLAEGLAQLGHVGVEREACVLEQHLAGLVVRQRLLEDDGLRYARRAQLAFDQLLQLGGIDRGWIHERLQQVQRQRPRAGDDVDDAPHLRPLIVEPGLDQPAD